jgi:hypothetical protein
MYPYENGRPLMSLPPGCLWGLLVLGIAAMWLLSWALSGEEVP